MREKVKKIIEKPLVENGVLVVIIINSIFLGFMTSDGVMESYGTLLNIGNNICLGIFVIELLLKLFAYRFSFFKEGWNVFDFLIVLISLVPSGGILSSFRMLRTFRVFRSLRSLRMVTKLRKLKIIVQAVIDSLPSIAWTSLLLFIIYYIFAIIGTEMFGSSFPEWFGSIGKSFYTLFQIMTLESWSMGISRPVMEVYSWAYLYFVPFILFTAFIVLNVVIGVVVNTISDLSEQDRIERMEEVTSKEDMEMYSQYKKLQEQMKIFEKTFEKSTLAKKDKGE